MNTTLLTLIILGEITPHNLINSSPFRGSGSSTHTTLGLLLSGSSGSAPSGEEGGTSGEGGKGHGVGVVGTILAVASYLAFLFNGRPQAQTDVGNIVCATFYLEGTRLNTF